MMVYGWALIFHIMIGPSQWILYQSDFYTTSAPECEKMLPTASTGQAVGYVTCEYVRISDTKGKK